MQPEAPTASHDGASMGADDYLRGDDAAFTELYRREFARTVTLAPLVTVTWVMVKNSLTSPLVIVTCLPTAGAA